KTLNHERSEVMQGIERYARKQKEFSDQIRSTILQLRELQDRPDPDQSKIEELTNRVEWDTRIFEERRKTVNFVCEVPVLIERRLFALAHHTPPSLECGRAATRRTYLGLTSSVMGRSLSSSSGTPKLSSSLLMAGWFSRMARLSSRFHSCSACRTPMAIP